MLGDIQQAHGGRDRMSHCTWVFGDKPNVQCALRISNMFFLLRKGRSHYAFSNVTSRVNGKW